MYKESGFIKFNMLNLTLRPLEVFPTRKKYHCVWPLVLISFCKTKSYSLSDTLIAANRLPDSNLDSNIKVLSSGPVNL